MSPDEIPPFDDPPAGESSLTRKYWLSLAGLAAVVLGAWSLWLATASFKSTATWAFAKSTANAEPDLLLDDDGFEPIPTHSRQTPRTSARESVADRHPNTESVERAVHVTMTGVAEEIVPVDFQSTRPLAVKKTPPEDSPAGAWLTGAIETLEEPAEGQPQAMSEIPAWRRQSTPLKAQPDLRRTKTSSVRD